jgi:hypothetical protein
VARAHEPGELEGRAREFSLQILFIHIAVNSIEFYIFILGGISTSLALGI